MRGVGGLPPSGNVVASAGCRHQLKHRSYLFQFDPVQHAMSWIFDTQAALGTNPWSWEWGSPASQAGKHACGCLRCQVCSCHKRKKSAPPAASAHDNDSRSAPPTASAHDDASRSAPPTASAHDDANGAGILRPTFRTWDAYPKAQIDRPRAGDDILGRYIGFSGDTRMPTYTCVGQYPKAKIKHGQAGGDILNRYCSTHKTFAGAMVYIQPNGVNKPGVDPPSVDDTQPWVAWEEVYQ